MRLRKSIRNIGAMLAVAALAACGTSYDTGSDKQAITVEGATLHRVDPTLVACHGPNKGGYTGYSNKVVYYPVGQRTFDASTDKDAETKPVTITFGQVNIDVPVTVYFKLTSDCNLLKKFHKEIGSKGWGDDNNTPAYVNCEGCDDDHFKDGRSNYAGWISAMLKYVGRPLTRASTDAAVLTPSKNLDADKKPAHITPLSLMDGTDRAAFEKKIKDLLPGYVKSLAGEEYFTDFTVQVGTPVPPQEYADALTSRETARLLNLAQQEKNNAVTTELNSIRALVAVLGPQGYVAYQQNKLLEQAIKDGHVQVLPVQTGSTVAMPVPSNVK